MRVRIAAPALVATALLPVGWVLTVRLDDLRESARFTAVLTGIVVALAVAAVVSERRRPGRPTPPLVAMLAVLVLVSPFRAMPSPWWSTIGALVWLASPLVVVDLLLSYPDGLSGRWRRAVTVACWIVPGLLAVAIVAVSGPRRANASAVRAATWNLGFQDVVRRERNPLVVHESVLLVKLLTVVWVVWVVAVLAGTTVILVRRWRLADRSERRLFVPVSRAGVPALLGVATQLFAAWPERDPFSAGAAVDVGAWYSDLLSVSAIVALPTLAGVLIWVEIVRPRLARDAGGTLELPGDGSAGDIEGSLRRSLGDPTLVLAFNDARGGWVDGAGRAVSLADRPDRATTLVVRGTDELAALVHDGSLLARADEVEAAARVVAVALDNERLRAVTLAQAEAVRASGARMLEAADRARLELEGQIVNGPVALIRQAESALAAIAPGHGAEALNRSADLMLQALQGVRSISHGLAPPTLDQHGLAAALDELLERAGREVHITAMPRHRLPRAVETTVYVAVAHALDATAGTLSVECRSTRGNITLDLVGAVVQPDALVQDRVAALGGTVSIQPGRLIIRLPATHRETVAP